jgi:hypothetical protein
VAYCTELKYAPEPKPCPLVEGVAYSFLLGLIEARISRYRIPDKNDHQAGKHRCALDYVAGNPQRV